MTEITGSTPLAEVREWLAGEVAEGTRCPCCDRPAKIYRRPIHGRMARDLIRAVRTHEVGEVFHLPSALGYGGDVAKLAYWGLLVEESVLREDGGRAGFWAVTPLGRRFALGLATVQSHARIYNRECIGLDGPEVDIAHCLGSKFNLRELLNGKERMDL